MAAHLSQKTRSTSESGESQNSHTAVTGRAAQAAARVAERYAHAPSFSEMLADEARAAMRAAEAASKAAKQAHEAVQYVLAGLEAASPEYGLRPETVTPAAPATPQAPECLEFDESPLFSRGNLEEQSQGDADPGGDRAGDRAQERPWDRAWKRLEPTLRMSIAEAPADHEDVEAAEPIYANLIQFPREIFATRKMRPRRALGPLAIAATESQLSIFEVDPDSISTQPAVEEAAAPAWMRTEFGSIAEAAPEPVEDQIEAPDAMADEPEGARLAPLSRRLMAIAVDASLIGATFLATAMMVASHIRPLPSVRVVELCAALAVVVIGVAYQALCLTLGKVTPGMLYAGITMSTFEGDSPSRRQRCRRMLALPLSVLPLGLGLIWALFDDGGLTWHDRLSGTYLRRR